MVVPDPLTRVRRFLLEQEKLSQPAIIGNAHHDRRDERVLGIVRPRGRQPFFKRHEAGSSPAVRRVIPTLIRVGGNTLGGAARACLVPRIF